MCLKQAFIRKKAPPNTRGGMNLVYTTRVHGAGEQRAGRQPYLPDGPSPGSYLPRGYSGPLPTHYCWIPALRGSEEQGNPCIEKVHVCPRAGKAKPHRLLGRTRYQESGTHAGLPRLTGFKSILFPALAADALADSIQKSH